MPLLLAAGAAEAKANLVIVPNGGFDDPTVVAPVGGNPGTTLGEQRLAVFHEAARIWGEALDSDVPITILADFEALECDISVAVLGSAQSPRVFSSDGLPTDAGVSSSIFPQARTLYGAPLAERFAGRQLLSATGTDFTAFVNYPIVARFSSAVDTPECLGGAGWYYGFDGKHGPRPDLLLVVLHEFGHGLGFESRSLSDGTYLDQPTGVPEPTIWADFLYDETSAKHWVDLDAGARASSGTSMGLVWDGPRVKSGVPSLLDRAVVLRVTAAPATPSVVRDYPDVAPARFGPGVGASPISGTLKQASTLTGCPNLGPLQSLAGGIAVAYQSNPPDGCSDVEQALNLQQAGAAAILVVGDSGGGAIPPNGVSSQVTIPVLGITYASGQALLAAMRSGRVTATLVQDPNRYQGADGANRLALYAPLLFQQGASVSHWDPSISPSLLMQPFPGSDLRPGLDLTVPLLQDIGWSLVDVGVAGAGPATLASGQEGTFTFTVTNPGPSVATATTVNSATSGLTLISNEGDCTTAFPCALGDLPPGSTRVITSRFKAASGDKLTASVTLSSPSNYNALNDTAALVVNAGTGGSGGGNCTVAPFSGTLPWLLVLVTGAVGRRRRVTGRRTGCPGSSRGGPGVVHARVEPAAVEVLIRRAWVALWSAQPSSEASAVRKVEQGIERTCSSKGASIG